MNQILIGMEPDTEQAAIEMWRQTKNNSADWSWDNVNAIRRAAYHRMAVAVLSAAGCLNGLKQGDD